MRCFTFVVLLASLFAVKGKSVDNIDAELKALKSLQAEEQPTFKHGEGIAVEKQAALKKALEDELDALRAEDEPPKYEHKERVLPEKKDTDQAAVHKYFTCFTGDGDENVKTRDESEYAHQYLRRLHYGDDVPDLVWNKKLERKAKKHALAMAKSKSMYHSQDAINGKHGENVAYYGVSMNTGGEEGNCGPALMCTNWYAEIVDYNFSTGNSKTTGAEIGHFTAMIWKGVKKFGCALATAEQEGSWHKTYYACVYDPAPNVGGEYLDNVPRPKNGKAEKVPAADLTVSGCCDYTTMCSKYRRYCDKLSFLKSFCAVSCNSCSKK